MRERGIDETQAADLRARLKSFAEDWERPEMAGYDALRIRAGVDRAVDHPDGV